MLFVVVKKKVSIIISVFPKVDFMKYSVVFGTV